ncbi:hypothetical protein L218DRAFT_473398 [Marasmius fiardii PR-910]|nr:hypothetical protein L218DRAFT_473398 [Marasmius fiardii PR-910]
MTSYPNPLHVPVPCIARSSYSSLGLAIQTSGSSTRRRVPQTPMGKSIPHPSNGISFDFVSYPQQGIPLKELYARGTHALQQMMQGANDPVLVHTRLARINLHISWPGYEHLQWYRSIEVVTSNGPATRAYLASVIAQHFASYFEKAQYEPTRIPEWRLGFQGFSLDHIILLSLHHAFEDSFQVEVAVDYR